MIKIFKFYIGGKIRLRGKYSGICQINPAKSQSTNEQLRSMLTLAKDSLTAEAQICRQADKYVLVDATYSIVHNCRRMKPTARGRHDLLIWQLFHQSSWSTSHNQEVAVFQSFQLVILLVVDKGPLICLMNKPHILTW